MEEVFLRFRHLGEQIFEQLDNKDLDKCSNVSKPWNEFTSALKLPWIRMIKEYVESSKTWHEFFQRSNIETLKVIAMTMPEHFDKFFPKHGTPLAFAAMSGNIEIVTHLLKIQSGCLPKDEIGRTPLHYAAGDGHLAVFQMIVEKFNDVNPKDQEGNTPFHLAADAGNFEICQMIIDNLTNPNQTTENGERTLSTS